MANEIKYSGLGDLRLTETLANEIVLLLADRTRFPMLDTLIYAGNTMGSGSTTAKIGQIGLMGYDALSAVADGASVANTALTDASATVAVVRYSKSYAATDMARLTDPATGMIKPSAFAADAVQSAANNLVSLVANLVDNFSNTVGATTVNLSIANFLDAISQLEISNVAGPYTAILHPVQVGDLRTAVASAGGVIQYRGDANGLVDAKGFGGLVGSFAGVPIFSTTHVPTANAGADRAGGLIGRGAIAWADGSIPPEGDPNQLVIDGGQPGTRLLFERDRTARSGTTDYVTHAYQGVTEVIDACGVSVITDA